jgi:hypothetical protein
MRQGQKNLFWLQGELMALMQPQDVAVEAQVPTQLQRKLNYVFCFDKIQAMLICLIRAVFPKVRSADLFWSARVSNLVREKKICYSFCILSHLIIKFVNFSIQSFIFWSAEKISWIMWSAKFFFNVLWSASQESLGNTSLTT